MPYKCTACEKSFRYKVSQRTHKCQAQPPGTVVRRTGDLVEKLKKKHTVPEIETHSSKVKMNECHNNYLEISEVNAELARTGAKLSLEDMETENFKIFAENFSNDTDSQPNISCNTNVVQKEIFSDKEFETNIEELISTHIIEDKNVPSPSDIFKNLCLSNDDDYMSSEKANDIIKEFNDYL